MRVSRNQLPVDDRHRFRKQSRLTSALTSRLLRRPCSLRITEFLLAVVNCKIYGELDIFIRLRYLEGIVAKTRIDVQILSFIFAKWPVRQAMATKLWKRKAYWRKICIVATDTLQVERQFYFKPGSGHLIDATA